MGRARHSAATGAAGVSLLVLLLVPAFTLAEIALKKHNYGDAARSRAVSHIEDNDFFPSVPRFVESVNNVTVVAGRDVFLSCAVDNLQKYKVAWIRVGTNTILTVHDKVITRNYRISLSQADSPNWVLKIANVIEDDRGWYMCQLNTDPIIYQEAYVEVVVPPDIIDNESSSDTTVREGSNVSLTCAARGHPQPHMVWRREDGGTIGRSKSKITSVDGQVLNLPRVSRVSIGAYLCIASNGVPPSVSKRIVLNVQFPPVLSIPNQLEGTFVGNHVSLLCHIEAFPLPIVYWTTDTGDVIIDNSRIVMTVSHQNEYKMTMTLNITKVAGGDFRGYRCVIRNSLGETDGLIRLFEVPAATKLPTYDSELEELALSRNQVPEVGKQPSGDVQKYTNNGGGDKLSNDPTPKVSVAVRPGDKQHSAPAELPASSSGTTLWRGSGQLGALLAVVFTAFAGHLHARRLLT